jgi:GTP pyrophosphokinase
MSEAKRLSGEALAVSDARSWLASLRAQYGESELAAIEAALACAEEVLGGAVLPSGEPALEHDVATGVLLAQLHLDHESVAAGLLADAPLPGRRERERLAERVGAGVAEMVAAAARMHQIDSLGAAAANRGEASQQLEGLRKMLLAMVQDVRVVFLKLASHTQHMRYLVKGGTLEQRRMAARLALDIFAPLANRLGVWQLKWELEDLAFRATEPELYKRIARMLDEKRIEREKFIADSTAELSAELRRAGMKFEITGRPKHIYSIYKKMQRKALAFDQLYDVNALRVFVDEVKDCYAVLGIVHNLWTPIPTEFDDYIAKPKGNDYRSLHTAVIGPGGRVLEVQIRTYEMHRQAELGVAAHWRYKEGTRSDRSYDEKVAWLRQMLEWRRELAAERSLAEHFKVGLFDETVYVLTPQGKVVDLPAGSTPVDFAYAVHTDLGHRCRGARVDGVMVPLNTPLQNGQAVEIIASKQGGPSRDWLNASLGFTVSHRARAKVRQWFNAQNLESAIAQGRAVVEKELQRMGLTALNLESVASRGGFATAAEFFASVGRGDINTRQIQALAREPAPPASSEAPQPSFQNKQRASGKGGGILLVGVDKLLTVPAKCCKPAPPDPIIGFVTRGRGVTVHRANCTNLHGMDSARLIDAQWGESTSGSFEVDIELDATDRTGLLRDVSDMLARERINVMSAHTETRDAKARMAFTIGVSDLPQLERVLLLLGKVPGVNLARRR